MTDRDKRISEKAIKFKADFLTRRELMAAKLGVDPSGFDFHNAVHEDMAHKLAVQDEVIEEKNREIVDLRRQCDVWENRIHEAFAK